ncbi:hypothetical protein GX645_05700 [Candidatus Sumerlaeota bacterium]|nr:hypothetical protein [Candidatus Sumerlaeota bacterium]
MMKTFSDIFSTYLEPKNDALNLPKRHTFSIIVGLFVCWCLVFIWRSSFLIDGQRWFCLVDDAMVSMRYARNMAAGLGPVWNPNEAIEGFTNPLWMLFMATPHMIGIPEHLTSLFIQLASVIVLVTNLFAARRLGRALACTHKESAGNAAALFTACLYPLNYWSLMGMEVGCLAALATWAVTLAVEDISHGRFTLRPYLLCALATFIRMDAIAIFLALGCSAILIDPAHRKRIMTSCVILGICALGIQEIVRYAVYGEWLPNTYYLKMTGFPGLLRISRGLLYTGLSLLCFPVLFIVIFAIKQHYLSKKTFAQQRLILCPVFVFLSMVSYSVYVGGDAWERLIDLNRFVSTVATLLIVILTAIAFYRRRPSTIVIAILAIGCLIFRSTSPADSLLLRPPVDRVDNIRNTTVALKLRDAIAPTSRIAVEYAGTMPYFMPNHSMVDLLGKSDKHIARTPMHRNFLNLSKWREFYPGHLKWDYEYSIGKLQPEVICAIWKKNAPYAEPFLTEYLEQDYLGTQLYFLKGTVVPDLH